MAEWSDHDVSINGLTIHYYRMGQSDKPPVLLLHGYSDSGLAWTRLARDLAADYDLIMPDAVSHGRSSGPGPAGFRSRAVADVVALIEMLGLDRPALVGHSMGARTAAGVAAEAGDGIRCAVLEDPPWRDASPEPRAAATEQARPSLAPTGSPRWAEWLTGWKALTPEERAARVAEERPMWADEDRLPWAESKAQFNLDALNDPMGSAPAPWRDVVSKITCPVLLITADPERGGIVTPDVAREAAGLWRTGRVVQIAEAGHNIRRDQYAPFRTAVVAFLRENV